jgi:hypothetical protein
MGQDEVMTLQHDLTELQQEHRDLDHAIARLANDPAVDSLELTRLKKRKLKLKERISSIETQIQQVHRSGTGTAAAAPA